MIRDLCTYHKQDSQRSTAKKKRLNKSHISLMSTAANFFCDNRFIPTVKVIYNDEYHHLQKPQGEGSNDNLDCIIFIPAAELGRFSPSIMEILIRGKESEAMKKPRKF